MCGRCVWQRHVGRCVWQVCVAEARGQDEETSDLVYISDWHLCFYYYQLVQKVNHIHSMYSRW